MKRIKLVISDCHLGSGPTLADGGINPLEDFRKDAKFVEFLEYYTTGEYSDAKMELVINGDFFDLLQVRTHTKNAYEIFESVAVHKIKRILKGHPLIIDALKKFIDKGHSVKYIWGNHDAGIWWPEVRREIHEAISTKIEFYLEPYEFDGVRIEHGHQYEIIHHFDTDNMFLEAKGRVVLNYPFGSFFVAGFLVPLKERRSYVSQVIPFSKYIRWGLIFDFWFTLIQGIKAVLFFIKMRFVFHPYRFARFTKTLKIVYQLMNKPKLRSLAQSILQESGAKILIMGHNHEAAHRHYRDGTQYINTGTWTDVTSFDPASLGRLSRPTYAYIEHIQDNQLPKVSLKVWKGKHHSWEVFEP
ncbi:MAG: hypothetical protein IPM57_05845 [Oligoflexia bacterium]|nr:hypothetical protein [Oligoflexia bacterium]